MKYKGIVNFSFLNCLLICLSCHKAKGFGVTILRNISVFQLKQIWNNWIQGRYYN